MRRHSGWRKKAGFFAVFLLAGILTGCQSDKQAEDVTEVTVPGVEISTAIGAEEGINLALLDKKAYDALEEKEQEQALILYLTELYSAEETTVPEGEEYEELMISTRSAVESSLKTNPDITMQELLNQAAALGKYKEGFAEVTKLQYESMSDSDREILITACISRIDSEVPVGEEYQEECSEMQSRIETFFSENPDQNLEDLLKEIESE
ncbi:MAG: hypothetical protein Q4B70_17265 [Lachnospiraceae bacterium]|nr:hypothetical protein [Lachnospiraceae bacterium]